MAKCPKCGRKLRLTDLSQYCPGCGVNMRFVDFEENFYREAKVAELSQANMHVKVKRLKASFIGSKLVISRLVVMLLPLVSLLLPSGAFTIVMPFMRSETQFGALGIYGLATGADLNYVMTMQGSAFAGAAFKALFAALAAYAAVALCAVLVFLTTVLCFISIKNMQKVIVGCAAAGIAACAAALVLIARLPAAVADAPMLEAHAGYGLILTAVLFVVVIVINALIQKKGIPVQYDEGMEERVAIFKKVKAGEIAIDDLPQPVVETAETRKIDEEIAKEEENYKKKYLDRKEDEENG